MSTSSTTSPLRTDARPAGRPGFTRRSHDRVAAAAAALLAAVALAACGGPVDEQGAPLPAGLLARGGTTPAASSLPLSFSPAAITAGQAATVTVTLPSPAQGASGSVPVYLYLPSTVLTGPKFISIPNGARSGTFTVYANPYLAAPTSATVTWRTSTPNGALVESAVLSVSPSPAPPVGPAPNVASVLLSAASVTSGAVVDGLVTLTGPAPAGGLAVRLAFSYDFFHVDASIPDAVIVPAGASVGAFQVATHLSTPGITATSDFVVASVFGGPWSGAPLTIGAAP